jgi:hypothetical protein
MSGVRYATPVAYNVRIMARRKAATTPPPIELREFRSVEEIAIAKLERRVHELEELDIPGSVAQPTGQTTVAASNVRATVLEVFGPNSPEFKEHQHARIWYSPERAGMHPSEIVQGRQRGRTQVTAILNGLIGRLREKREDLTGGATPAPSTYFDRLNLHTEDFGGVEGSIPRRVSVGRGFRGVEGPGELR